MIRVLDAPTSVEASIAKVPSLRQETHYFIIALIWLSVLASLFLNSISFLISSGNIELSKFCTNMSKIQSDHYTEIVLL